MGVRPTSSLIATAMSERYCVEMPVHRVGKDCWQWGNHGHVYCGKGAKQKAERQAAAAFAHGYHGHEAHEAARTKITQTQLEVLQLIAEGRHLADYLPKYKPGRRRGPVAFPLTIATRAGTQLRNKGLAIGDHRLTSGHMLTQAGVDVLAQNGISVVPAHSTRLAMALLPIEAQLWLVQNPIALSEINNLIGVPEQLAGEIMRLYEEAPRPEPELREHHEGVRLFEAVHWTHGTFAELFDEHGNPVWVQISKHKSERAGWNFARQMKRRIEGGPGRRPKPFIGGGCIISKGTRLEVRPLEERR